jgi:hypothetical protein
MKHTVIKDGKEMEIETVDFVPKKRQPRSSGEYFVMMPLVWIERLQAAKHINSYRIAMYLRRQHFKSRGHPIKLSNEALVKMGISRDQKRLALLELEHLLAGLIEINRSGQRSPEVKILDH